MSKALSIAPPPIYFHGHRRIWSSRPSLLSFGHIHQLPIPIRTCLISAVGSEATASAWSAKEGPSQDLLSLDLHPISSEGQFDRIIAEAQQLEESVIIVWMAAWCRKCIYLKPKLEKLAVDYYPRIRFYCIDVNTVPQRLVNRAGITLLLVYHQIRLVCFSLGFIFSRQLLRLCQVGSQRQTYAITFIMNLNNMTFRNHARAFPGNDTLHRRKDLILKVWTLIRVEWRNRIHVANPK